MWRATVLALLLIVPACAPLQSVQPAGKFPNPVLVPIKDHDYAWEHLVAVVSDYFKIEREERVKLVGGVLTEGYLETAPVVGATWLEPWHGDSVGAYNRTESTLQTIRRRCIVRVTPANGGYLMDVAVFKELEDLPRPQEASGGDATFRFDASIQRYREPVGDRPPTLGWIQQGRDCDLEQRIIGRLLSGAQF